MQFECTEEEFRILEEIVQDGLKGTFGYCITLVLLGLKPGTTPEVRYELEKYSEELDKTGLNTRTVKLNFVDYSELPDYAREEKTHLPIFVTRNTERFEIFKQEYSNRYEYYKDFGLFLGYPEEDVEWYLSEDKKGNDNQYEESKRKLGSPEDFDKTVSTVMYTPKPTEERYQAAKNKVKKYLKGLRKADEKFNSEIGREIIEIQLEE